MIEVNQSSGSITIKGHAHYAPRGQDIVCAAVSTLVQNMVISISEMTTDEIQYDMQPGLVEIRYGNLSANAQLLVDSFFVGIRLISNEYPAYVQMTKH